MGRGSYADLLWANIFVSHRLFCVGKETDSVALQADAWHLRTDIYTSAGVMAGLAIIWIGELLFPRADLHWVDPLVAIGVALLILKAAWRLTMESAKDLMDVSLPEDEEECIRKDITVFAPTVRGFTGFGPAKQDRAVSWNFMCE